MAKKSSLRRLITRLPIEEGDYALPLRWAPAPSGAAFTFSRGELWTAEPAGADGGRWSFACEGQVLGHAPTLEEAKAAACAHLASVVAAESEVAFAVLDGFEPGDFFEARAAHRILEWRRRREPGEGAATA